jgi:hypothetical protein
MTRKGSTSGATLATRRVGRCNHLRRGKPIAMEGPRWRGVKGMIIHIGI